MAVCPQCGYNNPEGVSACGYCGMPFNNANQAPAPAGYPMPAGAMPPQESSKAKIIVPIVIGIILLIALITGVVLFVTHRHKAPEPLPTDSYTTTAAATESSTAAGNGNIAGNAATVTQSTTAAQGGVTSAVSDDAYNDMELLLSNLAETEVKDYDAANYSLETIISFSLFHRYINNSGGFQIGDPSTLPSEAVKKDAQRFFNLTLTESDMQSIPLAYYNAGTQVYQYDSFSFDYYIEHTNIEYNACHVVAVPTDITQESSGNYRVTFSIYQSSSAISDSEYKHRPDDAALTSRYTKIGTGTAMLQQHSGNEYSNYIVTEYHATY